MLNFTGKSLGRYHVVEQLGEGGMATVFKAFDSSLERYVAIKVIRTEKGMDEEFLKRFQREAKALAQLDHPYILKVLDYGEQDGIPYLVMPFVTGGTLKQRLGHPMPYQEAARLLAPIARALEYAHQQHIIHRDVKPANILITQPGAPILSDFGIAKILDTGDSTQLTGTGVGIGTPDYMAPEQWLGTTDARTDIYALGVVFYEMVTGRRPYVADTPAAVLLKHMQEPLPRPRNFIPSLPDRIEQVIFKAMAKAPEDRYQDMGAFATALEQVASMPSEPASAEIAQSVGPTVRATTPAAAVFPRTPSTGKKSVPGWAIGGAAILVIIGVVICLGLFTVLSITRKNPPSVNRDTPGALTTTGVMSEVTNLPLSKATEAAQGAGTPIPELTATPPEAETNTPRITQTKAPLTSIKDLPEDIPVLKDNNGDLITQENENMKMFMFSTKMDYEKAVDFYRTAMQDQGWNLTNTTTMQENSMTLFTYSKGSRNIMINLFKQEGDLINTWIQISLIATP